MGKSTISMAIFNSYVSLPEGTQIPSIVSMDPRPRSGLTVLGLPWSPPSNPAHQTSDWAHRTGPHGKCHGSVQKGQEWVTLPGSKPAPMAGYHWVCHMADSNHDLWNCWSQSCNRVNCINPMPKNHPQIISSFMACTNNPQTPVMPHSFWPINQSHHTGTWLWARSLWELQCECLYDTDQLD